MNGGLPAKWACLPRRVPQHTLFPWNLGKPSGRVFWDRNSQCKASEQVYAWHVWGAVDLCVAGVDGGWGGQRARGLGHRYLEGQVSPTN